MNVRFQADADLNHIIIQSLPHFHGIIMAVYTTISAAVRNNYGSTLMVRSNGEVLLRIAGKLAG